MFPPREFGASPLHFPLRALTRVWRHALASVEALLRAHGYAAVEALPPSLACARVGVGAHSVVGARLSAHGDAAVAATPTRRALTRVWCDTSAVVVAPPDDRVNALASFRKHPSPMPRLALRGVTHARAV